MKTIIVTCDMCGTYASVNGTMSYIVGRLTAIGWVCKGQAALCNRCAARLNADDKNVMQTVKSNGLYKEPNAHGIEYRYNDGVTND